MWRERDRPQCQGSETRRVFRRTPGRLSRLPGRGRACDMKARRPQIRDLGLVHRLRDDEDAEEIQKPLEWALIRRLFTYAEPVQRKLNVLLVLSTIRAAQLPAFLWITSLLIRGP